MARRVIGRIQAGDLIRGRVRETEVTWSDLAGVLDRSLVWTTSALLGQQPLTRQQAEAVGGLLDLDGEVVDALTLPPVRGEDAVDVSEPVVYRLHEIVQVYGRAISELVAEEFGDGIMSAIDFELDFVRRPDPKGDRVVLTMNGKFLPYRVW